MENRHEINAENKRLRDQITAMQEGIRQAAIALTQVMQTLKKMEKRK